jgi:hypothetical protein
MPIDEQDRQHNEELLAIHRNNLLHLEIQAAKYGSMAIPLALKNSIDGEKEAITRIEAYLGANTSPSGSISGIPDAVSSTQLVDPASRRQSKAIEQQADTHQSDSAGGGQSVQQDSAVSIQGSHITVGGDIVGRDKVVYGSNLSYGTGASTTSGVSEDAIEQLFLPLTGILHIASPSQLAEVIQKTQELKRELLKGRHADDSRVARLLDALADLVPGGVSILVSMFTSPTLAGVVGPTTRFVLDKLQGTRP